MTMEKRGWILLMVCAASFLFLGGNSLGAGNDTDEFIAGYATAVLELQFHILDCSVDVQDGVVTVSGRGLEGDAREMAVTQLREIPGVVRVVVDDSSESELPEKKDGIAVTCTRPPEGTFFPKGRVFEPLFGDPRWPHFSARYLNYHDNPEFDSVGAVSFGGSFPFYRGPLPIGGEWDLGIEGSVFSIFDLDAKSYDLVNSDFRVAFPSVGYRFEDFSALARLFHQSSHLGDEYLLRDGDIERENLSYEGVDLLLSYNLPASLRVYGGGGILFHRSPSSLEPHFFQTGLQFESPWGFLGAMFRPVAAVDLKFYQETDWNPDFSGRFGLQFGSPENYPSVYQLLFEYYNGYSPDGQFYSRKIEYFGIGLHYYY